MKDFLMKIIGVAFFMLLIMYSCQQKQEIGVNPYDGGKQPFGIQFTSNVSEPKSALPGEIVRLYVKGLKKYETKFDFFLNQVQAEIVALSDSTIDIKIPQEVSSGNVSIVMNDQIFLGPRVRIEGKVSVDIDYKIVNGFDGSVRGILSHSGGHIIVGSFTNFENQLTPKTYMTGIHFLNSLGQTGTGMDFRRRANTTINSIVRLSNGQFIIGGSLNKFSNRDVDGIARLNANGSLDTTRLAVINPDQEKKPLNGFDTISTLNSGFVDGIVTKVFATNDNSILVLGSFNTHRNIDYKYSSRDNRKYIKKRVRNVAKISLDGKLDSSYNINNSGLNGFINDAVLLKDGSLVIAGGFTNYNGIPVRNIVRINSDGKVDETFSAAGGTDMPILSLTYNSKLDKLIIAGSFRSYGGKRNNGVVVLNSNGSIEEKFVLGDLDGESANYAYMLNSGKILVIGSFLKYNGIARNGILILEPDGKAKQEYNNLGGFSGIPFTVSETSSSMEHPAILIGGLIFQVDGHFVGNIVKIEIKN